MKAVQNGKERIMNEIWTSITDNRNSISDHWLIASCLWDAFSIPLENKGSLRTIPNYCRRLRSIRECDVEKQAHKNLILCLSRKMLITITDWSIKKLKPYCCFNMIGFSRAFPEKICTQEFTL